MSDPSLSLAVDRVLAVLDHVPPAEWNGVESEIRLVCAAASTADAMRDAYMRSVWAQWGRNFLPQTVRDYDAAKEAAHRAALPDSAGPRIPNAVLVRRLRDQADELASHYMATFLREAAAALEAQQATIEARGIAFQQAQNATLLDLRAAESALAERERDAERYRYSRQAGAVLPQTWANRDGTWYVLPGVESVRYETYDAAIDAARSAMGAPPKDGDG